MRTISNKIIRTCEVPEDNHEAPLLVEHVPCLRDALFTLGTAKDREHTSADTRNRLPSVNIKTSSKNHESHILRDGVRTRS